MSLEAKRYLTCKDWLTPQPAPETPPLNEIFLILQQLAVVH